MNAQDDEGKTPLHMAAIYVAAKEGAYKITALLLANGARVGKRDEKGRTALSLALEMGHLELADLLRQHGAKR